MPGQPCLWEPSQSSAEIEDASHRDRPCLKAVAERAPLGKDNFWLPKFRATFATRCLRAGVDVRTTRDRYPRRIE